MPGDALMHGFSLFVLARSACWQAGVAMGIIGALALSANLVCFFLLYRHRGGNLNMSSTWLCSCNELSQHGRSVRRREPCVAVALAGHHRRRHHRQPVSKFSIQGVAGGDCGATHPARDNSRRDMMPCAYSDAILVINRNRVTAWPAAQVMACNP